MVETIHLPTIAIKNLSVPNGVYNPCVGKKRTTCKVMFVSTRPYRRKSIPFFLRLPNVMDMGRILLCLFAMVFTIPANAQSADNPSGLPLPRFATTRSDPINVRVGPGTRYDVVWVYVKSGQPVEIIQEFDTWRKIRDVEGEEGWIHQNLLSGRRAGLVTPWLSDAQTAIRDRRAEDANVRAWLSAGVRVQITSCENSWCAVRAIFSPEGARKKTYSGYVLQADLWGVYPDEEFD